MADLIVVSVLAVIVGAAVRYIVKAKKNGVKCIGCPAGAACGQNSAGSCCGGCSGCSGAGGCSCHADT